MFVDTPGIMAPKRRLETAMVKAASAGIADADLVLLVLDAKKGLDANAQLALRQLDAREAPRLPRGQQDRRDGSPSAPCR